MGTTTEHSTDHRLAVGVAARLARYLMVLTQAHKMGQQTISSQQLAEYTHVNSTQIRRDLSGFGKFGKRGVGYNVELLAAEIKDLLHTAGTHQIALFGAGNLGTAIATSSVFADHGFKVTALFDVEPSRIGQQIGPLTVSDYADLGKIISEGEFLAAVLAVPSQAAQKIADDVVRLGVKVIFNYSDALLQVPPEVTVHASSPAVDLLYALYFYLA